MTIAIGYITAPRPRPTLPISITTLRLNAKYLNRVIVSADAIRSYKPVTPDNCMVFGNTPALGNFRNWVRCAQLLLEETADPWLMICEDDVTWANDAYPVLLNDIYSGKLDHIGAGAYSMYLPIKMSNHGEKHTATGVLLSGYHHKGMQLGHKMWGAQCLMFRREKLRDLLSGAQMQTFYKDPRWSKNVDHIVAQCIEARGQFIAWRVPCLVDHVLGEGNSSLGYKDDRPTLRTRYFTGEA